MQFNIKIILKPTTSAEVINLKGLDTPLPIRASVDGDREFRDQGNPYFRDQNAGSSILQGILIIDYYGPILRSFRSLSSHS